MRRMVLVFLIVVALSFLMSPSWAQLPPFPWGIEGGGLIWPNYSPWEIFYYPATSPDNPAISQAWGFGLTSFIRPEFWGNQGMMLQLPISSVYEPLLMPNQLNGFLSNSFYQYHAMLGYNGYNFYPYYSFRYPLSPYYGGLLPIEAFFSPLVVGGSLL